MTVRQMANGANGIHARMRLVMAEVSGVEKTETNRHGGYRYAGHESVTAAIRGAFVRHGIVQTVTTSGFELLAGGHILLAVHIRWTCDDDVASYVEGTVQALQHCQTRDGKPTAQQVGQALSYAVKNFTFKSLMLTGDTEQDSDASHAPEQLEPPKEAVEFLELIERSESVAELDQVGDRIKQWGRVGETPGLKDRMQRAFVEARRRIVRAQ